MAYVDTSALVSCYHPEPVSPAVQAALAAESARAISELTEVEFYSALAIKVRTRTLSDGDATRLLARFRTDVSRQVYVFVTLTTREYHQARDWLGRREVPLRSLDALHLAVAHTSGEMLLTADLRLAEAAQHFGVSCRQLV